MCKIGLICTHEPQEEIRLWCIHATIHESTRARSYKNVAPLLSSSISCILCEQNNIMDIFSMTFWWLHQSQRCLRRDLPLGASRCRGCLIHQFAAVAQVGSKKKRHNRWTWLQNSDTSFSLYLWVEADVWDGGRFVVRLVPEGTGLVEVAPQLWETNRVDYCCCTVLNDAGSA